MFGNKMIVALAGVLVLAQALAVEAGYFSSYQENLKRGNDIKALCANEPVDLTTLTELKELALLAPRAEWCSRTVERALVELVQLIDTGSGNLCAPQSIEDLRQYYAKYLDTSGRTDFVDKELLPKSLKRLAIAYGMQMSNLCKKNMVRELTRERADLLSDDDYELLDLLAGDEGPVAKMLGELTGPGELFMPGDLAPFLKSSGLRTSQMGKEKIFIQTSTGSYVRQLQWLCQRRFEPIYGPLLMPLTRLANIGFNYKDSTLKDDLKNNANVVSQVGQWSRLVFLCESLKGIKLVEEPADRASSEGTDARLVRIITEQEAREIEAHWGAKARADSEENFDDDTDLSKLERVVYKARSQVALGNLIYDKNDARLKKAVTGFKTSRSERDIVKRRLFGKGFSMIKRELKQGHVGLIVSAGYRGIVQRVKGVNVPETREQLVRALDDLVRENEDDYSEGSVAGVAEPATKANKTDTFKVGNLRIKKVHLGEAKVFVISVTLVAIVVALMVTFLVVSYAWIG